MLYSLKKQISVPDLRLLIAISDGEVMKNIFAYMEPLGYRLDGAANCDEVRNCLRTSTYDALIMDALLTDQNGIPLYTCLRMEGMAAPVILLVPETSVDCLPRYVNAGADDIVTSPLHLLELETRVLAGIRLVGRQTPFKLSWEGIELDPQAHTVNCCGSPLHLPPMAFTLLEKLLRAAPNVVHRHELEYALYGSHPPSSDALRVYIHILRSRLEKLGKPILQTVPRVGFRLIKMDSFLTDKGRPPQD